MIRGFVAEGRTVLLSSHLLDEVEKICDEVAIVDRGRVVVQGSIAELAAGGEADHSRSRRATKSRRCAILSEHRAVKSAIAESNGIRVTLGTESTRGRRTTSAAVSSSRGSPFAASSRRARHSSSGSWRSRPDWRKQHDEPSPQQLRGLAARASWRPRLVSAEFLKLRKRRGLVLSTLALTVVPMIIGYTVLAEPACRESRQARTGRRTRELLRLDGPAQHAQRRRSDPRRRDARAPAISAPASSASWSSPDGRGSRSSRRAFPRASR